MRATASLLVGFLFLLALLGQALAQERMVVLDTNFETPLSDAFKDRLRAALVEGLSTSAEYEIVAEQATAEMLGAEAQRLMSCQPDPQCLAEIGEIAQARAAVVFSISEAGEIYTFTVDVYELPNGEGMYFSDSDCPLCTLEEAATELTELARNTMGQFTGQPAEEISAGGATLSIHAQPESAELYLNDEFLGTGFAQVRAEPGRYRLRATLAGYESLEREFEVAPESDDLEIAIRLGETPSTTASGPTAGLLDEIDTTAWGSVLVGTGIASLVTGIILLAIDGDASCADDDMAHCPEVFDTFGGGMTLTILGTVAVTSGTILLLWQYLAGTPSDETRGADQIGLAAHPEGVTVFYSTRF